MRRRFFSILITFLLPLMLSGCASNTIFGRLLASIIEPEKTIVQTAAPETSPIPLRPSFKVASNQLTKNELPILIDVPFSIESKAGQPSAELIFRSMGGAGLYAAEWSGGYQRTARAGLEGNKLCEMLMSKDGFSKTCYSVFKINRDTFKFVFKYFDPSTGEDMKYAFVAKSAYIIE